MAYFQETKISENVNYNNAKKLVIKKASDLTNNLKLQI